MVSPTLSGTSHRVMFYRLRVYARANDTKTTMRWIPHTTSAKPNDKPCSGVANCGAFLASSYVPVWKVTWKVVDMKMELKGMDWIHLAQDKYKWVFRSKVTSLLLAQNAGNFMIVWGTNSLSRKTLLHEVIWSVNSLRDNSSGYADRNTVLATSICLAGD